MRRAVSIKSFLLLMLLSFLAALVFLLGGPPATNIVSLNSAAALLRINFAFPIHHSDGDGQRYYEDDELSGKIGTEYQKQPAAKTPACVIPSLEPDGSWVPKDFKPLSCESHEPDPVKIVPGGILDVLKPANSCMWAEVKRIDDFNEKWSENYQNLTTGQMPCPALVFWIKCGDNFEQLFRCIAKTPEVDARVSKPAPALQPDQMFEERLNIIMFGLDSVSRVAWLEQMTKTTDYVAKNLDGVIFEGYNIVGDGTTAAILGLTSGYQEDELHETRRGFTGAQPLDDIPLLWKQLAEEASYTTLWDEDIASFGTFQYRLLGFNKPPVDYYGRVFQMELEKNYPSDACLGQMSTFEEMVRQFRHLFATYPDPVRKFALVFNSHYSHTSAGEGRQKAYLGDALLLDEIKYLHDNGHLNNSVLILFADHGSRFDGSRATARGKLSERLPFLQMAFPKWFQEKYPNRMKNFKAATQRLTTPFDLHMTLLDIGGVYAKQGVPERAISFFKPIPFDRTCEDAGISAHWCTCLSSDKGSDLALDDPLVKLGLKEFTKYVNNVLLAPISSECMIVRAGKPFAAKKLTMRAEVAQFVKTVDGHGRTPEFDKTAKPADTFLQMSFYTEPGHGQWEVTFTVNATSNTVGILPKQMSRTNRYGDAPKCIQERYPYLRPYCYCRTSKSPVGDKPS